MAFVEQASSSLPINGGSGSGSGGTIARNATTHLAGAGRVNLVNFSTCLHRLARVAATPTHPVNWDNSDGNGGRPEQSGVE